MSIGQAVKIARLEIREEKSIDWLAYTLICGPDGPKRGGRIRFFPFVREEINWNYPGTCGFWELSGRLDLEEEINQAVKALSKPC